MQLLVPGHGFAWPRRAGRPRACRRSGLAASRCGGGPGARRRARAGAGETSGRRARSPGRRSRGFPRRTRSASPALSGVISSSIAALRAGAGSSPAAAGGRRRSRQPSPTGSSSDDARDALHQAAVALDRGDRVEGGLRGGVHLEVDVDLGRSGKSPVRDRPRSRTRVPEARALRRTVPRAPERAAPPEAGACANAGRPRGSPRPQTTRPARPFRGEAPRRSGTSSPCRQGLRHISEKLYPRARER